MSRSRANTSPNGLAQSYSGTSRMRALRRSGRRGRTVIRCFLPYELLLPAGEQFAKNRAGSLPPTIPSEAAKNANIPALVSYDTNEFVHRPLECQYKLTKDKETLVLVQPVVPVAHILSEVDFFSCPEGSLGCLVRLPYLTVSYRCRMLQPRMRQS